MQLSVIIVNYNAAPFLELCLHSVQRAIATIHAEVIVVDNHSTDQSVQKVHSLYPNVGVIENKLNVGFARANNLGAQLAQGEYICILNPDTIVEEQVFVKLLAFAKANPKTAFTTTQLIDGTGTYLPESKRNVPTPAVAVKKILGFKNNYYNEQLTKDQNGQVPVLVGAMMVCKKAVYEQLGGFDERYFMYGEDIDLSYTAIQQGFTNYYMGAVRTIHFKGECTVKDKDYYKRFYGAMGLFYDKNFKRSAWKKVIINMAVKLLVFTKRKKSATVQQIASHYILVTDDEQYTIATIKNKISFNQLVEFNIQPNTRILWDVNSLHYASIINFMGTATGKQYTYRFINPTREYTVGSDSSSDRGTVTSCS